MIRILQINMHRSATTHELLAKLKTDLVLINGQYQNNDPSRLIRYRYHLDSGLNQLWASFM